MLHVYVADFGLSTMKSGTIRQFTAGTPGPEQLKGEDINTHSDVYSFGCNMYELFTENPVWEGLSAHTIMFRVGVKGEYPEISFAPPIVSDLLSLCFNEALARGSAIDLLNLICDITVSQ